MPYLNASAVVIHYEEALYQVYAPYSTTAPMSCIGSIGSVASVTLHW